MIAILKPSIILAISMSAVALHAAANITQINRYATVANKPLAAQVNPLLTVQQIHFPQEIKTVGEAIEWWLHYSGFSLVNKEKQLVSLQAVMYHPLPQTHKNLGPLTVKEGLEILVGQQVFTVIEDPIKRQVNFKLKPAYQPVKKVIRSNV